MDTIKGAIGTVVARGVEQAITRQLQDLTTINLGFDTFKVSDNTRSKKRKAAEEKVKKPMTTLNIGTGWFVDFMTGLNHSFPNKLNIAKESAGLRRSIVQTQLIGKTTQNIPESMMLLNNWSLAAEITPRVIANQKTVVWGTDTMVRFSNMSNYKIIYEFYYVTPVQDMAVDYQDAYAQLATTLDTTPLSYNMQTLGPEKFPLLKKSYKILSKAVFRLGQGETGEIHIKDKIYRIVDDANRQQGRTFQKGINTQLMVRYWGQPLVVDTVENPFFGSVLGDNSAISAFIMEKTLKWSYLDINNPNEILWSSTLPTGTAYVQQGEDDLEIAGTYL